ncbi:MAG: hypothetical protein LUG24_09260 [Clostridiales bacterium]|nr:hypothetical protein [Clostridiales bacterium]
MQNLPTEGWKNVKNTGNRKCKCKTWENHWEKYSGSLEKFSDCLCANKWCLNSAEVGAHVSNDKKGKEEFIIPLCRKCNALTEKFDVDDDTFFASANRGETCGY